MLVLAVLFVAVLAGLSAARHRARRRARVADLATAIGIAAWVGGLLVALGWLRIGLIVARGGTPSVVDLFNLRGYLDLHRREPRRRS